MIFLFVLIFTFFITTSRAMEQINTRIVFITGTSGSGKSTLIPEFKKKLTNDSFEIYDFDENGVPQKADAIWRKVTTNYWITKAQYNSLQGKSTIVCGVCVPLEIIESCTTLSTPIYFGFIKISNNLIEQRLKKRGWKDTLIQDNINWSYFLEKQVLSQKII